jgi:glutaredoxin
LAVSEGTTDMHASKWLIAASTALLFALGDTGTCLARTGDAHAATAHSASAKAQPDIVMYATQDCGYCKKARQYFTAHNVTWREIDIESSEETQKEWRDKGGMGTPLIFIGSVRIEGYMQSKMDDALAQYAP